MKITNKRVSIRNILRSDPHYGYPEEFFDTGYPNFLPVPNRNGYYFGNQCYLSHEKICLTERSADTKELLHKFKFLTLKEKPHRVVYSSIYNYKLVGVNHSDESCSNLRAVEFTISHHATDLSIPIVCVDTDKVNNLDDVISLMKFVTGSHDKYRRYILSEDNVDFGYLPGCKKIVRLLQESSYGEFVEVAYTVSEVAHRKAIRLGLNGYLEEVKKCEYNDIKRSCCLTMYNKADTTVSSMHIYIGMFLGETLPYVRSSMRKLVKEIT